MIAPLLLAAMIARGPVVPVKPPHWSHPQMTESDEYRHWKHEHHG